MKQIPFYKLSGLVMNVLLLTFVITSCTKKTTEVSQNASAEEFATASGGNKPGTVPEVLLKVTVDNSSGYNITSDGGGDYVNGSQVVGAKFDQYGNFIFSCGTSGNGPKATLVRWMNINFSQPIEVFINPPITGNDKVTAITTGIPGGGSHFPLQNLAIGQSFCIGLTGGSNSEWVMNFHRDSDAITNPSAYAVFTKINATQWTVTPAGDCSPNSNVCSLRYGPGTLYGYYNMPFAFTLTSL